MRKSYNMVENRNDWKIKKSRPGQWCIGKLIKNIFPYSIINSFVKQRSPIYFLIGFAPFLLAVCKFIF